MAPPPPHYVDVIIPTYRPRPGMLAEAVASALASPLVGRVIVVDDGSQPAVELPEELLGAVRRPEETPRADRGCQGRVKLLRQANAGPGAARNRGLAASEAPWALLLDDDDLVAPEGLDALVELSELLGAVGGVAARIERSAAGDRPKPAPAEWAGQALPRRGDVFRPTVLFNGSGILVRRDGAARALRFDEGLFVVEDRDFLRRLADLGPIAVSGAPLVIARRRDDGSNLTAAGRLPQRIRGHVLLLRRYLDGRGGGGGDGARPWMRAQTMWLLNAAAKAGVDAGHWALLVRAARAQGWQAPVKARARRAFGALNHR